MNRNVAEVYLCWQMFIKCAKMLEKRLSLSTKKRLSVESFKCANLVDLKKMLQNEHSLAKISFDTAENKPSKVMVFHFIIPQMLKY